MKTGYTVSGGLHAAFVLFLLFGGLFSRDRLPEMQVADVSVLSEAEFAALFPPTAGPEVETDAPEPRPAPAEPQDTAVPEAEPVPERTEPSVTETPAEPEPVPDPPALQPQPPAEIAAEAPVIAPPAPSDQLAAVVPDAAPAPAPRVAPEAAPPPPLEAETAPEATPEVAPEPDAPPTEVEEESDAAAPDEATTEIVTEAERERTNAPVASMRPRARPERRVAEPAPEPEPEAPPQPAVAQPDEDAIAAAVNQANEAAAQSSAPSGPPMTSGERDAFRLEVQRCWVVDVGSESANVTVVVAFSLSQDGRVVDGSLRQLDASGGSEAAINTAFQAARRAILRCGASGYDLPVDKYDQWRDIEITFNPEGMRLR